MRLLLWRKAASIRNTLSAFTHWQWVRNGAFSLAGIGLLFGIYHGSCRFIAFLNTVPLISSLLLWKLTAMVMLTTFSMVLISSLLTSLTTLYYSFDLKFLMNTPLSVRSIFIDKSLESVFFASWAIGLVLVPYVAALVRVNHYGAGFYVSFLWLMIPFLLLAGCFGICFTLVLLYCFPSSRTRDVIWVASSFSLTLVYGAIRFSQPEKLIRPDALRLVADYLNYLQAPTAPYLPSWWLTKALSAQVAGQPSLFWLYAGLLWAAALTVYGLLIFLSGYIYFEGYSGAQEGGLRRRFMVVAALPELRWMGAALAPLFWKERKTFLRDVKHWSQILLVLGLVFVYLFSIRRLPLDSADLRSMVSFLNIGAAGFVMAALGLRFAYPSISLEGRSWWVVCAAPVELKTVMRQKLLFSAVPMTAIALTLGAMTNYLLAADAFISRLSVLSLLIIAWALCAMAVGFGALFPMFAVENIHQIESSLGGFIYMASSLFYVVATVGILAWPVQMHFQQRFGRVGAWHGEIVAFCAALWLVLNAAAFLVPWRLGRRALEAYEG